MWQLLNRNALVISASASYASLDTIPTTFQPLFAVEGKLFNFLCHLKVTDVFNTVVSGGAGVGGTYIKAYLLKDPPVTSCL